MDEGEERQDPLDYFRSYLPLAAYTLGLGSAINGLVEEQPVQLHPDLLILNVMYLLAIFLVPGARTLDSGLLHSFIAVHFVTMVVYAPYDYENRLVMPMYLFEAVFAAAVLAHIGRLVTARLRRSSLYTRLPSFGVSSLPGFGHLPSN